MGPARCRAPDLGHPWLLIVPSCVQAALNMALFPRGKLFISSSTVLRTWPAGNSCSLAFVLVPKKQVSSGLCSQQLHLEKTRTTFCVWSRLSGKAPGTREEAALEEKCQVYTVYSGATGVREVLASRCGCCHSPFFSSWLPEAPLWS